jgi:hypothetical protein
MEWKNQLTRTPYLVVFIVLIAIGVGTASALITITLSGDVVITGFLDMTGDKITNVGTPSVSTDAATKGYVDQSPTTDTLALLACSTDQIAKFDGNDWICVFDVSGKNCGPGFYLSGFDSTGNVICVPNADRITMINTTSTASISIDKGTDNIPAIAYVDSVDNKLRLVSCNDAVCSDPTITTINSGPISSVGVVSIDKGTDNLPTIAYVNSMFAQVEIVACNDVTCTSPTITPINSDHDVQHDSYISLDKGTDNIPAIAWVQDFDDFVRIAVCNDVACTSPTIAKIDNSPFLDFSVQNHHSLSLDKGTDNIPAVVFMDSFDAKFVLVACNDKPCTTHTWTDLPVPTLFDNNNILSLDKGTDNLPTIAYVEDQNKRVNVVACNDAVCSTSIVTSLDDAWSSQFSVSLDKGTDNLPAIAYVDIGTDKWGVVACNDATCTTRAINEIDTSSVFSNLIVSLDKGTDNLPAIAYLDEGDDKLRIVACNDATCTTP